MNTAPADCPLSHRGWYCGICWSALSAVLSVVVTSMEESWLLGCVCLVPWLWAIRRSSSLTNASLSGLMFGVCFGLLRLDWIRCIGCRTVWEVGSFWSGWLAASILIGLAYAVVGAVMWHTMTVRNFPATAVLPLCVLLVEAGLDVFTRSVVGTTGDLARLAVMGTSVPYLILVAANDGATGLSAAIACLNGIAFDAVNQASSRGCRSHWAAVATAVMGLGVAVWLPMSRSSTFRGESCEVILVSEDRFERHPARVEALLPMKRNRPSLLIWPEMACAEPTTETQAQAIRATAVELGCHILIGTARYSLESPNLFNSAVLIDAKGQWCGAYDKQWLGPGVESPFSFCPWTPDGCSTLVTQFSSGTGPRTLSLPEGPTFGVGICHDVCFPEWLLSLENKEQSCQFLVMIANERFEPSQRASELLLRVTKLRAIEAGIPIIRCARGGTSGLVHPDGRLMNVGRQDQSPVRISVPCGSERLASSVPTSWFRATAWAFVWLPLSFALVATWSGRKEIRHDCD